MKVCWQRCTHREEILRRIWWFHIFLVVLWGKDTELRDVVGCCLLLAWHLAALDVTCCYSSAQRFFRGVARTRQFATVLRHVETPNVTDTWPSARASILLLACVTRQLSVWSASCMHSIGIIIGCAIRPAVFSAQHSRQRQH